MSFSGKDLINNLIDELNRARDILADKELDYTLISDIDADLDKYWDNQRNIDRMLGKIQLNA